MRGWSAPGDPDTDVNGIEAVRAYFGDHIDGCAVAPFTDALTHVHGTVGFTVLVGESVRTVEVAYELLEPEEAVALGKYLEHVGLIELMRAIEEAAILVTPAGAVAIPELKKSRAYLVVEDDPDFAEAVDGFLRSVGGTVCRATRIDEAEQILADLHVDGIVVDLQLPDGDGLVWLTTLVGGGGGFDGRRVVCSGQSLPDQRLDELERSGAVFLEKPFSRGALAEALGIDVERSRPEPDPGESEA